MTSARNLRGRVVLTPPTEAPGIDRAMMAPLVLVVGVGWLLFAARREGAAA